jgi:nitroimidazol reductase NimA-like FMN-containing flavoprotein (pyridoxamine 5'-phosphate oxidase superfamily)
MSDERSVDERAREIIDRSLYMVLGTADRDGLPWASPVYYAPLGYREFLWISDPGARHSRNIAARPEVGIVIFDSSAPINTGQGVYMDALAAELSPEEAAAAIEIFSRRGVGHGAGPTTLEDVRAPAKHRLYRARASVHWVLDERDNRLPACP